MIVIKNVCDETPYKVFTKKYKEAISAKQKDIEVIAISSYSKNLEEVNSRYVNLKFLLNKDFIFFSNYQSSKAEEFMSHQQISALIYWNNTNTQIRLKAKINKTNEIFNKEYFAERADYKNALSISSKQSKKIDSYEKVVKNYNKSLDKGNLFECPEYWGGYSFAPYYFEFWTGHESRLNKREVYELVDCTWTKFILQP